MTAEPGHRGPQPGRWIVLALLGLTWGTTWIATDALADQVPPLLGAAVRFLLAALILLPVLVFKHLKLPGGRVMQWVLLLSVTLIVLPVLLVLWARDHIPSATVTVLFSATPLLVMFLTPAVLAKPIARSAVNAAIVALGALALAVGAFFSAAQTLGAAVVLVAVASTGISSLWARRELGGIHPIMVTTLLFAAAAPLLFLASLLLERGQAAQWNGNAVAWVAFLAVVPGAAAYATWFWLLQQMEPYQVATVQWIAPLAALAEGAVFLRVGWSWSMLAGSLVTLLCLWLVMRARSEDDESVSLMAN